MGERGHRSRDVRSDLWRERKSERGGLIQSIGGFSLNRNMKDIVHKISIDNFIFD